MTPAPRLVPLLAAALLAGLSAPAMADSMRCGSHLVVEGDTTGKLRSRCGEPAQITRTTLQRAPLVWFNGRAVYATYGAIEVPVEIWEYNFGPTR